MKIAVCFFGITRSLTHTIASINANVLGPARSSGQVKIFCHFYRQDFIDSSRTGEFGRLDQDEYSLLSPDVVNFDDPEPFLSSRTFEEIRGFGDHYGNDFHSLNNLLLQLHSIDMVARDAMNYEPDICIFARPDLEYHDSFEKHISHRSRREEILIPSWGHAMGGMTENGRALLGVNDRFAICFDKKALGSYGMRIHKAKDFCREYNHGLHAESLVRYALERDDVDASFVPLRASRVRSGGRRHRENFDSNWRLKRIKSAWRECKAKVKMAISGKP